eukprot:XP_011682435.1 PREDICTED: uncharacterized protein LOC105446827 [Strongylocentrotus purpuratus]
MQKGKDDDCGGGGKRRRRRKGGGGGGKDKGGAEETIPSTRVMRTIGKKRGLPGPESDNSEIPSPSIKMSWTKDDETLEHTSPRTRQDAGGNLHISELQEDDAGTYSCLTTYWETTITTTVVKLNVGGKGPAESGSVSGIPFPWIVSAGATLVLLIVFGCFTIATKSCSGDKSKKYTKVPDEEMAIDDDEEGDEEDVEV